MSERPPETREELRWLAELPRPWDPPTCPRALRGPLWRWLDDVVTWINVEHTWRIDRLIPVCWQQHPHIAHEVATVACQRHNATYAVTPDVLEDWHKYTLPPLLERIACRIGPTGCPLGGHQPCPAATRHLDHRQSQRSMRQGPGR